MKKLINALVIIYASVTNGKTVKLHAVWKKK